jgi:predicted dehydrogenase
MPESGITRRQAISSLGALAAPCIVPGSALGLNGASPPSDRITMAAIGQGPRGRYVLGHFLEQPDVRVLAVADCFADRRLAAKDLVDHQYGDQSCAAYRHHERVLERGDIDAVLIATGDRWHAVLSGLAVRAGKDVYCEKPFCLTVGEGRALVDTVRRYAAVWQCGTQRKSIPAYRFVADVVREGRIGRLHTITLSLGSEGWGRNAFPAPEPEPDPETFDYGRWLGQAPWAPYSKTRVAMWRLNWDTSAGVIADMGPHFCDIAQWAHGDESTAPVEFSGEAEFHPSGINDTPYWFHVRARYADGVRLFVDMGTKAVRFDGDKGWIQIFDEGAIAMDPPSIAAGLKVPDGNWKIMRPHIRNFLECVRSRALPVSHPEVAQRAHTVAHLAGLSLRLGRRLRWDPATETVPGDDEANRMLRRAMRAPWFI